MKFHADSFELTRKDIVENYGKLDKKQLLIVFVINENEATQFNNKAQAKINECKTPEYKQICSSMLLSKSTSSRWKEV